jgi:hypothetical protein
VLSRRHPTDPYARHDRAWLYAIGQPPVEQADAIEAMRQVIKRLLVASRRPAG